VFKLHTPRGGFGGEEVGETWGRSGRDVTTTLGSSRKERRDQGFNVLRYEARRSEEYFKPYFCFKV